MELASKERLDKWIARQGVASRREAGELIRARKITVNGVPASGPDQKVGEGDVVLLEGVPLLLQRYGYLMLNKPAGVLSATRDSHCETVLDLVPAILRRPGLFVAGRLDKDTEGFALITDDGAFAHRILSPKRHVPKTYFVRLDGSLEGEELRDAFARGISLGAEEQTSPARLTVLKRKAPAEAELVIYEGMYHQVKRMFAQFGLGVVYLKRTAIGGLALDESLAPGECRSILHNELRQIDGGF